MSKILELADAYARETHPALITEARAALAAEVSKLEQEHIQRLLRIEKEVDVLIAERDALRAENERLTQQAFTLAVECDELRMELGDLPESQAEMLTTIKELRVELEAARKDAARYRWLQENIYHYPYDDNGMGPELDLSDAAIDAAIGATK